ncbi:MAG: hypothetical protein HY660_12715 [Armatimonadetes bacterium]|nr:hypothetical protein [Armatimonadota bacterium]
MDHPQQPRGAALAEEALCRLAGVVAARVETDARGAIEVVHVLARPERSPKILANDVVSLLAAELGLLIDPRQIRIALLRADEASAPAPAARLKFSGLTVSSASQAAEIRVILESGGLTYEGNASGPGAPHRRLDLVAEATLRAVETFLRTGGLFVVDGVSLMSVGTRQVAVAVVSLMAPDEELLCGSSIVRDDAREAVVRAVLDAVNRPVSWLAGA